MAFSYLMDLMFKEHLIKNNLTFKDKNEKLKFKEEFFSG